MTTTQLSALTSTYPLQADQVASYRSQGFLRVRGLADRDEAAAYREVLSAAVGRLSTQTQPLEQRDTYGRAFLQVFNLWRHDERAAEFTLASRFASVAARLLGVERVRIYHDQALFKKPGGGPTPWHQDQGYWPLDTDRTITMWMPLVDLPEEVGSMTFADGSHLLGDLRGPAIGYVPLPEVESMFAERGLELRLTDPAVAMVADRGYDPVYGARPLKRAIQKLVIDPLASHLLAGDFAPRDKIIADVAPDGTALTFHKQEAAAA